MSQNYQKIFESLSLPCLLIEPRSGSFIIKDATQKYCRLIGRKREELLGFVIPEVFTEDQTQGDESPEIFLDLLKKTAETGNCHCIGSLRYDIVDPMSQKFEKRYWTIENVPVMNDDGTEVEFILHTVIDKTADVLEEKEIVEVKQELEQTAEQKEHFTDSNPDGLYSLDNQGRFLSVNEGLVGIMQTSEDELLEMDFLTFCSNHDKDRTFHYFQKVLQGEKQEFEGDFISANGREMVLRISLVPMKINGEIYGAYGIAKDVIENRITKELIIQKEQELKRSQIKYKALVQEAFDLVGVLDISDNYKFVSESSLKVLGVPPEEFIGKNAFDLVHPDDKNRVIKEFSAIETRNKIRIAPFRCEDADGNWRWLEANVTNRLEDPNIEGVVINSREITDLIKKTCEVEELNERYKLAASATGDLIYDWDLVTNSVQRFFKGKEKLLGYRLDEMIKRNFWKKYIHPEELDALRELQKKALSNPARSQIRSQYRFKRADGSYAHIIDRGMIVRDENGKAIRMIGATSDVSGLIDRKNNLKVANKRFSYAMKATQEMIWDWDLVNNSIERSKSFEKIIGPQENGHLWPDQCWFEKIAYKDQQRVKGSLNKALDDPKITKWKEEYKILKYKGSKSYVIDRGYIIRDSFGKAIRMVGATLDVTESRRMLKEIKKQNKVLKEVAWEQAHIVRAPLARLKGLLELFDDTTNEEWSQQEILGLIKDSAEELDSIVSGIIRKTENFDKN